MTVIISLYGFLEQYVEGVVRAFITQLSQLIPKYAEFPPAVTSNHVALSVSLLSRLEQRRYRGLSQVEIIANLHACLAGETPFKLNADAYAQHSANVRAAVVEDLVGRLGVTNASQRIRDSSAFEPFLRKYFPGRRSTTVDISDAFRLIDDLAERRNDVAHGVPAEILAHSLLIDYIEAVEAYAQGLHELLTTEMTPHEARNAGIKLGKPVSVFATRVFGVHMTDYDIAVGDSIIVESASKKRPFKRGEVLELQIGGVQHDYVSGSTPVNVGVKLSESVKASHTLYLIPRGRSFIRRR